MNPWLWRRPSNLFVAAALARYAFGTRRLKQTLATIDTGTYASADAPVPAEVNVHIVVPLLREQPHVGAAIDWFTTLLCDMPGLAVTLVTTTREDAERGQLSCQLARCTKAITTRHFPLLTDAQAAELEAIRAQSPDGVLTAHQSAEILGRFATTAEVVDAALADPALQRVPIRHVRYEGEGRKAAQVNHAVERIDHDDSDRVYVAVYDVDSRPDRVLIERTLAFTEHQRRLDGAFPSVVQQSARFVTHNASRRAWERAVCRGAARLQTLWTLRREIPDLRRYARATGNPTGQPVRDALARRLAQTVGHGLWVRLDVFRRLGGLPTFTLLDDLPFGYRLTIEQIPVHVLPYTQTADAPEDVAELISQGRRWFHNYLDYPRSAAAAAAEGHGTPVGRAVALAIGSYRGAVWLLRTPTLVICAALVARRNTALPVRCAAAAAVWLAVVAPVRLLAAAEARPQSVRQCGRECLEHAAGYLLTSVGPALAVIRVLFRRPALGGTSAKTRGRAAHPARTEARS